MASAGGLTRVSIYCEGSSFYGTPNPSSKLFSIYNQTSKVSETIEGFLAKQGVNTVLEPPAQIGSASGGMGMILTAGKVALQLQKVNTLLQKFREKQANNKRRSFLPNIVVKLEILQDGRGPHYPTQDDLSSVQQLVTLVNELADFLKTEYPILSFEYLIVAPKGSRACFSIYVPDSLITNINIMKIVNSLSKEKAKSFCTIKLERKLWFLSKVSFSSKPHKSNAHFNGHHRKCEVAQW